MSEQEIIISIKKELRRFDPILRKNLLSFGKGKTPEEQLNIILKFKKAKHLDTPQGIRAYIRARKDGCRGCKNKK